MPAESGAMPVESDIFQAFLTTELLFNPTRPLRTSFPWVAALETLLYTREIPSLIPAAWMSPLGHS